MKDELQPGDYVTASVRLLRPLAQGGMGTVWLAEHLVLDTKVVVKLMTKEVEGHSGAAARFAREAAVAAAVKSPHVVQVFDSGVTAHGVAFIVMELLEGHDLGVHISARGRLLPNEVAIIMAQLGKALARAHRVGVVHRDLKPDNIFLCDVEGGEPFVKLLDFGTAKDEVRAPNATTFGQLIGTPYYMSPEQITGQRVDARTDIWSLGVVAYEALTGTRPFEGVTVGAITLSIHTTVPRMTAVVPELPDTLDAWFACACALDPSKRFQTARAATEGLILALSGDVADPESVTGTHEMTPAVASSMDSPSRHPTMTVATPLSSTLSSPGQRERRTMMWVSGLVGVFALSTTVAIVTTSARGRNTPSSSLPDPSPMISALPPVTPKAIATASASPNTVAIASASAAASAPSSFSSAPASAGPSPFPFAPSSAPPLVGGRPSALPSARASTSASAKPPPLIVTRPLPSASASPSASAPPLPPAPEPAPPEPAPPPIDLRDLLPPTTTGP